MKHTDKDFKEFGAEGDELKSKTQIKQQADDIKKLGLKLLDLSPADLATMPLTDDLQDALALAKRINRKKDGYRRQIQFIGKLLREYDLEPIQQGLLAIDNKHQLANAHFHRLELLRDKLVQQGDSAIQDVLDEYPHLDRQRLRQWVRQIAKQKSEDKPPKAAREIFQYLKDHIS